jgi:DNA-binding NarL/FixJ family response regulator
MEAKKPDEKQVKIVQMLANGTRQEEIGVELTVSVRTIQTMVKNIRAEFGLKGRESVCMFFYKNGWIQ